MCVDGFEFEPFGMSIGHVHGNAKPRTLPKRMHSLGKRSCLTILLLYLFNLRRKKKDS